MKVVDTTSTHWLVQQSETVIVDRGVMQIAPAFILLKCCLISWAHEI